MKRRKKILIYHCGAIGDTVVVIPLIQNIIRHNPDAVIDFFNSFPGESDFHLKLVEDLGKIRNITRQNLSCRLTLKTWWIRFRNLMKIRREKYDEAYILFLSSTPEWWKKLFQFFTNINHVFLFGHVTSGQSISKTMREEMKNVGMLFFSENDRLQYPLSQKSIEIGKKRFSVIDIPENTLPFVIGVGGKSHDCMYWPMFLYQNLLRRIVRKNNLFPIIIGAPSEKEKANQLLDSCGTGVFICDLQAPEIIAFMKYTAFYLGNDTGTMHLADSAGLPCITLFSNKDIYKSWFPEGDHHINIIHLQQCGECRKDICPLGNPAPCIAEITVDEVETAVNRVLKTIQM